MESSTDDALHVCKHGAGSGEYEANSTEDVGTEKSVESPSDIPLPKSNREYGDLSYWDDRFAKEERFEWLVSFADVKNQLIPFLSVGSKVLVVGCGNSSFSADMYDAGYTNMWSLDYSSVVIDAMKMRNGEKRPEMKWLVMDMTAMTELEDETFDVVIDKAAMDALMVKEGDVWNPNEDVVQQAHSMCQHISRVLKPGGSHLHISFAQPYFRKKYLLGWHHSQQCNNKGEEHENDQPRAEDYAFPYAWSFRVETIAGDDSDGCFHHFLYIMVKKTTERGDEI